MKKTLPSIFSALVILGILFANYMVSKYGEKSSKIIIYIALVIGILSLIGAIISTKNLFSSFIVLMIIFPLIIMTIGIYLDNLYISGVGFLLIFILLPITIKLMNTEK